MKYLPIILLILGDLCLLPIIYDDYGIGWDENSSREIGIYNAMMANSHLGHMFYSKEDLDSRIKETIEEEKQEAYLDQTQIENFEHRMYGPAFELGLVAMEKIFGIQSDRSLYLSRHITTHIFFLLGILCFYLLLFHHFKDWKVSLLGTVMLLLVPRLYPHSFFNPKDIPFLTACILATFTMFKFLDKPTIITAIIHGLISAFAIDIRIIGIAFPFLTLGLMGADSIKLYLKDRVGAFKSIKSLSIYGISLLLFTILFWPYLWDNPIDHFLWAFQRMSKYPWTGSLLFQGTIYTPMEYLPPSYFPVWFAKITPPIFLIGFFLSIPLIAKFNFTSITSDKKIHRLHLVSLFMFAFPVLTAILLNSVLYDGIRHFYFVYPFFIISSLLGFIWLKDKIQALWKVKASVFYLGTALLLLPVLIKMVVLHPYQNVYFNSLSGTNLEEEFEGDYWGVSYKAGLDYVLKTNDKPVKIMTNDSLLAPVQYSSFLLKPLELEKVEWVYNMSEADYFLTTYRAINNRKAYLESRNVRPEWEVFNEKAGEVKILSVFKLQKE
jgi:hypothetical protein